MGYLSGLIFFTSGFTRLGGSFPVSTEARLVAAITAIFVLVSTLALAICGVNMMLLSVSNGLS